MMAILKHLLVVAVVSGICAALALVLCFWASEDSRRIAAIVAANSSAVALTVTWLRARDEATQSDSVERR